MGGKRPENRQSDAPLIGEFALIEQVFAPLAEGDSNSFRLTDDAALITPVPGRELVVTADMMVAGVHFFADDPPSLIARKLLRVNLSDLAAKGAVPHGYILTVALTRDLSMDWLRAFADGLMTDQGEFGINLLGGDTVSTDGPLTLSLTAMGWVGENRMPRRNGGKAGDGIYVTGTIGDAFLGLRVRRDGRPSGMGEADADYLKDRYLLPRPRVMFGRELPGLVNAAIDVSDGLAADLGHICARSGAGARIELDLLPVSEAARRALSRGETTFEELVTGGDDYEVLAAAPAVSESTLLGLAGKFAHKITKIGYLSDNKEIIFIDDVGREVKIDRSGYRHF